MIRANIALISRSTGFFRMDQFSIDRKKEDNKKAYPEKFWPTDPDMPLERDPGFLCPGRHGETAGLYDSTRIPRGRHRVRTGVLYTF